MAFTLKYGDHIRIDIFSGQFSPRTRAVIDLLGYSVLLPLMVWLASTLFQHLHDRLGAERAERPVGAEHAGVAVPAWCSSSAFLLLALQIFAEVIKTVRALRAPRAEA